MLEKFKMLFLKYRVKKSTEKIESLEAALPNTSSADFCAAYLKMIHDNREDYFRMMLYKKEA